MDLELTLHDLHAVELALHRLYGWLAEVLADDREAAVLFERMSREERSHAELVQAQIRLVAADPELVVDFDHVPHWEEVRALLDRIAAVRATPLPPSVGEALTAAIEFEGSGAELYSVRSLVHSRREVRALLERLTEANREHKARLIEFARRHSGVTIG